MDSLAGDIAENIDHALEESKTREETEAQTIDMRSCKSYHLISKSNPKAKYLVVVLNKIGNRFGLVCMHIYQKHIFNHLRDVEAYKQVTDINEKGIARLVIDVVEELGLVVYSDEVKKPGVVATLYSTPKIHKEIYGERYIFGGSNLPLAPMTKILSVSMRLCFTVLGEVMAQMWLAGANEPYVGSTIVTTSDEVARKVQQINSHVAAGRFTLN
jgi:hypothetical protein